MTENYSKARQTAEKAFNKAQVETTSRGRAFEEVDAITQARQEKTSRLREARLASEARNAATPSASPPEGTPKTPDGA